jgi:acyl carrier protein
MATSAVEGRARQLLDEVSQVVATVAPIPPPYKGGEHLYNELGLDSVQALNLLLSLEERFGVTIDDQRFVKCTTLSSLTEFIHDSQAGVLPL